MILDKEIVTHCVNCNDKHLLTVNGFAFSMWKARRTLAQNAFPHLTIDERELLISGVCGKCFNEMFGETE